MEQSTNAVDQQSADANIIQNIDIPGPPFRCPECFGQGATMEFRSRPALGVHRRTTHGVKGSASAYSQTYYQRKKAERQAAGQTVGTRHYKARKPATKEETVHEHNGDTEDQFAGHIAFTAGYITCFIETYAKGNGLSGTQLARRLGEFLHAKSR